MRIRNRILSHVILILLLVNAVPLIVQTSSDTVSAAPDTHTWDGGGANALASTKENWIGDVAAPEAGDSVSFNAGVLPCTWDLAITLNSFSMTGTNSGTVTVAATTNWGTTGDILLSAGILTGDLTSTISCAGNFIRTIGGDITPYKLNLKMTGIGKALSIPTMIPASLIIGAGAAVSIDTAILINGGVAGLQVENGGILTLNDDLEFNWYNGWTYSNNGAIIGTGSLCIGLYNAEKAIDLGSVDAPTIFKCVSWGMGDRTISLVGATSIGNSLTVQSDHVSYTLILDLSASNYALSATSLTIGTRGIINGRGSIITCSGNWDSSAGTFTAGTSLLEMTGTTKTLKTALSGGVPYNLMITGSIATTSDLTISNNLLIGTGKTLTLGTGKTLAVGNEIINNGALQQAGNAAEISGGSPTPLTGFGTFDGEMWLTSSPAILYVNISSTMTGYLHASKQTRLIAATGQYLEFTPDSVQDVNITALTYGDSVSWACTSTCQVNFTVSGLESGMEYYVYVDGIQIESLGAVDGKVSFSYSGPWSEHDFEVSQTIYTHQIALFGALIGLFVALGIIVSIMAVVVHATREERMLKIKDAIMMAICIVIGMAILGVIYALLP